MSKTFGELMDDWRNSLRLPLTSGQREFLKKIEVEKIYPSVADRLIPDAWRLNPEFQEGLQRAFETFLPNPLRLQVTGLEIPRSREEIERDRAAVLSMFDDPNKDGASPK